MSLETAFKKPFCLIGDAKLEKFLVHPWVDYRRFGIQKHRRNKASRFHCSQDEIRAKLYRGIIADVTSTESQLGSIFNLEFSPTGDYLVAATAKNSIFLIDPHDVSSKITLSVKEAHKDCVNLITFIDNHTFASCSDDKSIAVWDSRKLRKPLTRLLHGHKTWVKNAEYLPLEERLLTSAFDNKVLSWDLKKCGVLENVDENSTNHSWPRSRTRANFECVMKLTPIGRMTVTPKWSDISFGHCERKLIVTTRNGYLVLVHNFNLERFISDEVVLNCDPDNRFKGNPFLSSKKVRVNAENVHSDQRDLGNTHENTIELQDKLHVTKSILTPDEYLVENDQIAARDWSFVSVSTHPYSTCCALRMTRHHNSTMPSWMNFVPQEVTTVVDLHQPPSNKVIDTNFTKFPRPPRQSRLLYYRSELNTDPEVIKEIHFNSDGRLLCSPHGFGYRILAFSPEVGEVCDTQTLEFPSPLVEVKTVFCHRRAVTVAKFSPRRFLIASGSLDGTIRFSHPETACLVQPEKAFQ